MSRVAAMTPPTAIALRSDGCPDLRMGHFSRAGEG
jgi:hypothetical protein